MKFNNLDTLIQEDSGNTLDLINFKEIRSNSNPSYPAFIVRGQYIKTITKFPWVDFFNLPVREQEERVKLWSMFLSGLKIPVQILIVSKEIDTHKYLRETIAQVENTPYLNEVVKKRIIQGLPQTLDYIKSDGETSAFKKEYYIITSCRMWFIGSLQEDTENEKDTTPYQLGVWREYNDREWSVFNENFNIYYAESFAILSSMLEEGRSLYPLTTEEEIIWLFAELNNDLPQTSIIDIKHFL